jgi:hypothetical protein
MVGWGAAARPKRDEMPATHVTTMVEGAVAVTMLPVHAMYAVAAYFYGMMYPAEQIDAAQENLAVAASREPTSV